MFGKNRILEEPVTVGDVRNITGTHIVVLNPSRRDGWNPSLSMQIHKMCFIREDNTIFELQANKAQQKQYIKGSRGIVRYKKGKLLDFIPE